MLTLTLICNGRLLGEIFRSLQQNHNITKRLLVMASSRSLESQFRHQIGGAQLTVSHVLTICILTLVYYLFSVVFQHFLNLCYTLWLQNIAFRVAYFLCAVFEESEPNRRAGERRCWLFGATFLFLIWSFSNMRKRKHFGPLAKEGECILERALQRILSTDNGARR